MKANSITQEPFRPELTFPPDVAERVCAEYGKASVILEYGSGGSTVLAAELPRTQIFSVESDKIWAANLRAYVMAYHPEATVTIHHADIGPTREWGHPRQYTKRHALRYLGYSRTIWKKPDFIHPDLVLIDGRFRVGCFLTCLSRIVRPTRILFDDYVDRPAYHIIENYCSRIETVGRMAIFDATPQDAPKLTDVNRFRAELNRIWSPVKFPFSQKKHHDI